MPEPAWRQRRIGNPAATVPESNGLRDIFLTNPSGRPRPAPFEGGPEAVRDRYQRS